VSALVDIMALISEFVADYPNKPVMEYRHLDRLDRIVAGPTSDGDWMIAAGGVGYLAKDRKAAIAGAKKLAQAVSESCDRQMDEKFAEMRLTMVNAIRETQEQEA